MIETRNGSDQVLKQHVWGLQYPDVHRDINQDPACAAEDECERPFWICQDANFNVLGVVIKAGDLIERYEYTPYGQRTVYSHGWILADLNGDGLVNVADLGILGPQYGHDEPPALVGDLNGNGRVDVGDNAILGAQYGQRLPAADPLVTYPRMESFRSPLVPGAVGGSVITGLCEVGHQGLLYDKEFGLYYNRARMLHPTLGRFLQRDPLGYVDGMSLYEYVRSDPCGKIDPHGRDAHGVVVEEEHGPYVDANGNAVFPESVRTIDFPGTIPLELLDLEPGSYHGQEDEFGNNPFYPPDASAGLLGAWYLHTFEKKEFIMLKTVAWVGDIKMNSREATCYCVRRFYYGTTPYPHKVAPYWQPAAKVMCYPAATDIPIVRVWIGRWHGWAKRNIFKNMLGLTSDKHTHRDPGIRGNYRDVESYIRQTESWDPSVLIEHNCEPCPKGSELSLYEPKGIPFDWVWGSDGHDFWDELHDRAVEKYREMLLPAND